jgi:hypothetical protein
MKATLSAKAPETADRTLFVKDDEGLVCAPARYLLMALGWLNVGLGVIGLFLPLMPTTVFLLIALWLFSKSSVRFQRWLYDHPKLGSTLRAWHAHRAIPTSAKFAALGMMSASWMIVVLFVADGWLVPVGTCPGLGTHRCVYCFPARCSGLTPPPPHPYRNSGLSEGSRKPRTFSSIGTAIC